MTGQKAPLSVDDARRELFFKLALAFGVVVVGLEIGYLVTAPFPYDHVKYMIGRDFVNAWVGAKLALSGDPASHFGVDAYNQLLSQYFGANYPTHIWSYPPHLLLFSWPLALLPYMTSYVLYCAFGLIVYVLVVSEGSRRHEHLLLLLIAPAVTANIWTGQNGFLVTALLVGGLIQLDRRPILAGVLFGILTIKPQLGLLLPIMLVLTGRWRTIFAAIATVVVLFAATSFVFGFKVWTAYIQDAMPAQRALLLDRVHNYMVHMPTAFMNARIAGLSVAACFAIQAVFSVLTLAAVVWTFWRKRDPMLSNALLVTAVFTVSPYAFNYDMVLFSWVIIKLMDRNDNDAWDYGLMLAVWAIPFMTVAMGITNVMPFSFLPIFAFGARLVWRIWKVDRTSVATQDGVTAANRDAPTPALALADAPSYRRS
jgi:alpha-1,2-mannosyltransferase